MRHFIIPICWSLAIGVLCGLPGSSFPEMSFWQLLQFDSFAHAFVFALFSFLWGVALSKQVKHPFLRRNGIRIAAITGILYGGLIEVLQFYIFVRRSAEWPDMLADAIGCLIGWMIFSLIYRPVLRTESPHLQR